MVQTTNPTPTPTPKPGSTPDIAPAQGKEPVESIPPKSTVAANPGSSTPPGKSPS